MKRTGIDHPKFRRLAQSLNVRMHVVIGVCELLYHFTAKHAIQGDVGKWSDEDIAIAVDWPQEDAKKLVRALIDAKLIDESADHRLVIHDWHEHADESTKKTLANRKLKFITGCVTRRRSGNVPEGSRKHRTRSGKDQNDSNHLSHALPEPEPIPAPKPLPIPAGASGKQAAGVFSKLSDEELGDAQRLQDWYELATKQRKPVIKASEHSRLMVFASAERAIEHASTGPPMGLFAWLVSEARWDYITAEQEDRARAKMQALDGGEPILPANTKGFAFPEPRRPA